MTVYDNNSNSFKTPEVTDSIREMYGRIIKTTQISCRSIIIFINIKKEYYKELVDLLIK